MTALRIADAIDALVTALQSALPAVLILDGPPVAEPGHEGIAIGASREDNSVEWTWQPAEIDGDPEEHATITCLAWYGSGDTVFALARDRVVALVGVVDAVLTADRTLAGAVTAAWITGGVLQQEQSGAGALVTCEFSVEFDRY